MAKADLHPKYQECKVTMSLQQEVQSQVFT